MVLETLVVDRGGAAKVVDTNDEWSEVLEGPNRLQIHRHEPEGDEAERGDGNLEIRIGDNGIAVRFEVKLLGFVEGGVGVHGKKYPMTPPEERPELPLKTWFVSAGTLSSA